MKNKRIFFTILTIIGISVIGWLFMKFVIGIIAALLIIVGILIGYGLTKVFKRK